jgi:hypothetical protein
MSRPVKRSAALLAAITKRSAKTGSPIAVLKAYSLAVFIFSANERKRKFILSLFIYRPIIKSSFEI